MELQRFLIQGRPHGGGTPAVYDIFDPPTQEQMGVIRERSARPLPWLHWLPSKRIGTAALEVRETEDESLVFTVYRTIGLWRCRIKVYDADDHLMGFGMRSGVVGRVRFWIYDRHDLPFAEIKDIFGRTYSFLAPDGRELATATREQGGADRCLISISDLLAGQPLAKMLLLGGALALSTAPHGEDS